MFSGAHRSAVPLRGAFTPEVGRPRGALKPNFARTAAPRSRPEPSPEEEPDSVDSLPSESSSESSESLSSSRAIAEGSMLLRGFSRRVSTSAYHVRVRLTCSLVNAIWRRSGAVLSLLQHLVRDRSTQRRMNPTPTIYFEVNHQMNSPSHCHPLQ